jgi:hypothetical protein
MLEFEVKFSQVVNHEGLNEGCFTFSRSKVFLTVRFKGIQVQQALAGQYCLKPDMVPGEKRLHHRAKRQDSRVTKSAVL